MGDHVEEEFLSILIFVRVFLGSVSAYMFLKMYSVFKFNTCILAPVITTWFGIALLLNFVDNFPNTKYFSSVGNNCW